MPLLPIAAELVRRGHEVRWYTGAKYAGRAERLGVRVEPYVQARDYDDAHFGDTFPGRDELKGLRQIQFDIRHIFVGQIEGQLRDLQAIQARWPADVVLAEQTLIAALLQEELGGPPCALLGVLPLGVQSRDTAPFGLGLMPDSSGIGQWRNRALHWAAQNVIFRAVGRDLRGICERTGVAQRKFAPPVAPSLMLQATVASFEYPQRDLPRQLHFIGPVTPPLPARPTLPPWWSELLAERRPVVLVTQGTLATDPRELIGPTLRALAGEPVLVVAAGVSDPAALGDLPVNARIAGFVPFQLLLPYVSVFVTNGGYGGVQQALSHGLPLVVAGDSEDKAEVANRVQHAGVGFNLRTRRPSRGQLRAAVRSLIAGGPLRERAAALGQELRGHDAVTAAVTLVERLASEGGPVERASDA